MLVLANILGKRADRWAWPATAIMVKPGGQRSACFECCCTQWRVCDGSWCRWLAQSWHQAPAVEALAIKSRLGCEWLFFSGPSNSGWLMWDTGSVSAAEIKFKVCDRFFFLSSVSGNEGTAIVEGGVLSFQGDFHFCSG